MLFLDEVGEMSPSAQAKFLRVLQEREFQRLGGTRPLKANVRVIAATNRELRKAMERGDFREDLYYRLQVFEIRLPPLRERPEDILPLSEAFLEDIGHSFGRPPAGMTREAKQALLDLSLARQRARAAQRPRARGDRLRGRPDRPRAPGAPARRAVTGARTTNVKSVERQMIEQVLRECGGNKSKAARRLGLTRKQLYVRLRLHAIST